MLTVLWQAHLQPHLATASRHSAEFICLSLDKAKPDRSHKSGWYHHFRHQAFSGRK